MTVDARIQSDSPRLHSVTETLGGFFKSHGSLFERVGAHFYLDPTGPEVSRVGYLSVQGLIMTESGQGIDWPIAIGGTLRANDRPAVADMSELDSLRVELGPELGAYNDASTLRQADELLRYIIGDHYNARPTDTPDPAIRPRSLHSSCAATISPTVLPWARDRATGQALWSGRPLIG